jgi:hypothetical protein
MDDGSSCPSCGARLTPAQEYCLECGARLPRPRGLVHAFGSAWRRRLPWYPGDWIWPTLATLAIAAAGAAAAIASTGSSHATPLATSYALSRLEPAPTATTAVAPAPRPAPRPSAPAPTPKPPPSALIGWPHTNGYTIVLASLPTSVGAAAAQAKAKEAIKAGLTQVGILISSRYASLHPGYYVVFSGVFQSLGDAQAGLSHVIARAPNAYARQIAR